MAMAGTSKHWTEAVFDCLFVVVVAVVGRFAVDSAAFQHRPKRAAQAMKTNCWLLLLFVLPQ